MWKEELIFREGNINDGTTIPRREGRLPLFQQLGLETSRRSTIEMNSPNLDHWGP